MKIILIAALMFMGCATVPKVELVSEVSQIEYIQSIVGEKLTSELVRMMEYNPYMGDAEVKMILGRELMKILKEDKQIQAWIGNE